MELFGFLKDILKPAADTIDNFTFTDEEKAKLELEKYKYDIDLLKDIQEVNKIEASTKDKFIAGWRPFIGWIGGIAIAYHFVFAPFLYSIFATMKINFPLPTLDIGLLLNIVITMLGFAGLRTYEKTKGIHNKH